MPTRARRTLLLCAAALALLGCQGQQEVAPLVTPTVTISRATAPIGSPVEMTYRFSVAPGASFDEDYRVFVHFLDADREVMWTDDHDPSVPTRQWKPGETIEYTRTLFLPKFPYVGETTVQIGLHSPTTGERVPMDAPTQGLREYDVTTFNLTTQSDSLVVVFRDGWHRTEVTGEGVGTEWQWSQKEGVLAFRNPMRDATLYLQIDQPMRAVGAQQVTVRLGDTVLDAFELPPGDRQLRVIPITREQMGDDEAAEVAVVVDRTFVPADIPAAQAPDQRALGVRVFRAFLETK